MSEIVALILIGMSAGVLAGLFGIGGGLVIVPAMTALLLVQGVPAELAVTTAVATALGSMLLTSAASAWSHARRGNVDWPVALRVGPAVAFGALAGAWLAMQMGGAMLARVFAVFTALIALRMLLGAGSATRSYPDAIPARPRGWWLAGPLIGAVSAMIGIGGGSFNVPWLVWNGYSTLRAVGIAAACGWPIALGGSLAFMFSAGLPADPVPRTLGYLYLPGVIVIGIIGSLAAPLGVRLAHRIGSTGLARLFGVLLLLIALRMAFY